MTLFRLDVNRDDWRRYQVEGEHAWMLPPLICDVCGETWKRIGEAYPEVDGTNPPISFDFDEQKPLTFAAFEVLRHQLRPLVPKGAPLNPGTTLGPFRGTAQGKPGDVVWNEPWTMFIRRSAFERLLDRGVRFSGQGVPRLAIKRGDPVAFAVVEPVAIPLVDLSVESLRKPVRPRCKQCGDQPGWFERFLLPAGSAIPEDIDLCRAGNNPAVYIASSRFVDAARALELTGYVATPLPEV